MPVKHESSTFPLAGQARGDSFAFDTPDEFLAFDTPDWFFAFETPGGFFVVDTPG